MSLPLRTSSLSGVYERADRWSKMRNAWCLFAIASITILSFWPQLHFWFDRGSKWQGMYIVLQMDELLYSGYTSALVDGRPRKTDPIVGRDDRPTSPMSESLFSIQYLPPLVLSSVGRALGLSASTLFIILLPVAGMLGSASIYWLLVSATENPKIAAIGTLATFAFAGVISGQGIVGLLIDPQTRFLGLPFLRRYEPSAPWPLFFLFCGLTWQIFTKSRCKRYGILAGIVFAVLVFSYFYLWTAALAWFALFFLLWMTFRREGIRSRLWSILPGVVPAGLAVTIFCYLLTHVPSAASDFQVFTYTRSPDLVCPIEIISFILISASLVFIDGIRLRTPAAVLGLSLLVLPFLLLNQQIVTGRSVQPFHYEVLVGNYAVIVGAVLMFSVFRPALHRTAAVLLSALCIVWTFIEVESQYQPNVRASTSHDEAVLVLKELRSLARTDGTWQALRNEGKAKATVLIPSYSVCTLLPTWAPQPSLLTAGALAYQTIDSTESVDRLFLHMYFSGYTPETFRTVLNSDTEPLSRFIKTVLFGPERVVRFLGNHKPIREDELDNAARAYEQFLGAQLNDAIARYPIAYVVARPFDDLSNVNSWYVLEDGIVKGDYVLYKTRRRP